MTKVGLTARLIPAALAAAMTVAPLPAQAQANKIYGKTIVCGIMGLAFAANGDVTWFAADKPNRPTVRKGKAKIVGSDIQIHFTDGEPYALIQYARGRYLSDGDPCKA